MKSKPTHEVVESAEATEFKILLPKDVAKAAQNMTEAEVLYCVNRYYQYQDDRKRSDMQFGQAEKADQPNAIFAWAMETDRRCETAMKKALDVYSDFHPVGRWMKGLVGIGPVIAAGMIGYLDITKAPTAGHFWSYAGLNPNVKWLGKVKAEALVKEVADEIGGRGDRVNFESLLAAAAAKCNRNAENIRAMLVHIANPNENPDLPDSKIYTISNLKKALSMTPWNPALKVLCWKAGESFVKRSGHRHCLYGHLYLAKKEYYLQRNQNGDYADRADALLPLFDKATESYKALAAGKLPQGHVHAMAKRFAVKIFLSHVHQVMYEYHYRKPAPAPFPIAHLGHVDMIHIPNKPDFLS